MRGAAAGVGSSEIVRANYLTVAIGCALILAFGIQSQATATGVG